MHPQAVGRWYEVGGGVLICWRAGGSAEGSGQAGPVGPGQLYEVQQGSVLGPALGSHQPQAALQAGAERLGST